MFEFWVPCHARVLASILISFPYPFAFRASPVRRGRPRAARPGVRSSLLSPTAPRRSHRRHPRAGSAAVPFLSLPRASPWYCFYPSGPSSCRRPRASPPAAGSCALLLPLLGGVCLPDFVVAVRRGGAWSRDFCLFVRFLILPHSPYLSYLVFVNGSEAAGGGSSPWGGCYEDGNIAKMVFRVSRMSGCSHDAALTERPLDRGGGRIGRRRYGERYVLFISV